MTNIDNILKTRDVTLPTKVCIVKAMVSQVVMYGCENFGHLMLRAYSLEKSLMLGKTGGRERRG